MKIAIYVGHSLQMIHNVVTFLRKSYKELDYFKQYIENKKHCGRYTISLTNDEQEYIQVKVAQGWTPDVISYRTE